MEGALEIENAGGAAVPEEGTRKRAKNASSIFRKKRAAFSRGGKKKGPLLPESDRLAKKKNVVWGEG